MIAGVPRQNAERFPREFEALFRRCGQLVYRAAYNVTGNREDAQDVLQAVFLKLIQRRATNDIIKNPDAYLHRAAVHEALSVVRSRENRRLTGGDVESVEMPAPAFESGRDDDIRRVREAMASMKPEFLEILNLHYIEGYTCVEIAERHDKFLGTVLADLFRARAELRKLIRIEEKRRETPTEHETDRSPGREPKAETWRTSANLLRADASKDQFKSAAGCLFNLEPAATRLATTLRSCS